MTDYTVSGNYIGAGTPIIMKVDEGVIPVDNPDAVAMQHDFDYLKADGDYIDTAAADIKAVFNLLYNPSVKGLAMGTVLSLRTVLDTLTTPFFGPIFRFNQPTVKLTDDEYKYYQDKISELIDNYKSQNNK